jgi:hypothetical protein
MPRLSAIDTEIEARPPKTGSERSFGLVFAGVLAIIGIWPLLHGHELRLWPFPLAGAFLLAAMVAPRLLRPLNVIWLRLGTGLNRIVAPVAMGAVFFLTVVPVALIMRLFGKDPLRLRPVPSNWIERRPPGPDRESMKHQF